MNMFSLANLFSRRVTKQLPEPLTIDQLRDMAERARTEAAEKSRLDAERLKIAESKLLEARLSHLPILLADEARRGMEYFDILMITDEGVAAVTLCDPRLQEYQPTIRTIKWHGQDIRFISIMLKAP
jgi:hypothetical protein